MSSISPFSGISPSTYAPGAGQPRRDLLDLSRALKSGDLSGAQQAFSSLTQDLSSSSNTSPLTSQLKDPNSPLGQDLSAIGQDLQNGNLSAAQQDFTKLRQDIKTEVQSQGQSGQGQSGQGKTHGAHGHHHHNHADNDGGGNGSVLQPGTITNNDPIPSDSSSSNSTPNSTDPFSSSTINISA